MIFLALLTSTLFELPKFWLALIWTGLDWTDPQRVTHIPKNHSTLTLKSPQAPVRFRRSMRLVLYAVQHCLRLTTSLACFSPTQHKTLTCCHYKQLKNFPIVPNLPNYHSALCNPAPTSAPSFGNLLLLWLKLWMNLHMVVVSKVYYCTRKKGRPLH